MHTHTHRDTVTAFIAANPSLPKEWQMAKERQDINVVESEQKWYLKSYVVADLAFFHLVLIHGVDVLLHLYDASGGQRVFTLVLNKENSVESNLSILEQNDFLGI